MTFQDFVCKKPRPSCQVLCVSFLLQLQQMLSLSFASALSLAPNGRCRVLLVLGPVLPCAETSEKERFSCYKWLCHFLSRWKYRELQIDAHNAASPARVAFTRALGTNHSSSDFYDQAHVFKEGNLSCYTS